MSTMTIVVLIAGYLGFVGFVLALLTAAKRSDEAAERHARAIAPRSDQLWPPGAKRDAGFADAEFLERLDRRAAPEFKSRRFVRDRNPATKRAPRGG